MAPGRTAPRAAPRGPAAAGRPGKADRDGDGDIPMGLNIKGRGRIGKPLAAPSGPRKDLSAGRQPRGFLSATAHREILRKAGAGDVSMKEARPAAGTRGGLVELKITGWNKSKASGDADGGVSSLLKWLEKKASHRLGSRVRSVKIKKSHVEGSDLIIKVPPEDVGALVRMNGYGWAGVTVNIERLGGAVQGIPQRPSSEAEKTKTMLKGVLERRYDADAKFLNLSKLADDQELKNQHIFDQKSTASKFFPAMMRVLELAFDSSQDRDAAIESVSLADNGLQDLTAVTTLSQTLPKLHNLDLSNNNFDKFSALHNWRRRFTHLRHLILTGNPLEQNDSDYAREVLSWYGNLRMLNNIQVRTEEEVAARTTTADLNLPFPIRSAHFRDEGGIAADFVRTFFVGFDRDRLALAAHYYDADSEFSYAVNTQSPRDPACTEKSEAGEWEGYLKQSRNLKKISQLPTRQNRKSRGTQAVREAFAAMPGTKHPDLAAEAKKWIIEAKMTPGVPDPSGASPTGVDGFLITIHGEFDELDDSTGQAKKKRSFDRTFIIGPAAPGSQSVVRIVSDLLTVRGYGGTQAFDAEDDIITSAPLENTTEPYIQAGLTLQQAEQMAAQLSQQTGMTLQFSKECLDQSTWNPQTALQKFENAKAQLPPTAFVQQAA